MKNILESSANIKIGYISVEIWPKIRKNDLKEKFSTGEFITANAVFDTSYSDFDEDLMNDMMLDFYGGKDSIAFASSYNYFSEDFNALLSEFILD